MRIRCKIFLGKGRKCIQKSCDRTKDLKEAKMTLEILLRIPDGSDGKKKKKKKNLPSMQETGVQSLACEDPPEKGMATHSIIPAWRTPWTEEPGRLQSTGSQRVTTETNTLLRRLITSGTLERLQKDLSKRKL